MLAIALALIRWPFRAVAAERVYATASASRKPIHVRRVSV
jgi:hypothetical protein